MDIRESKGSNPEKSTLIAGIINLMAFLREQHFMGN